MQGKLGDRLIGDLMRELAQKNASGLLRVSKGKTIKAIFFDSGIPVFAISNLASEQLDQRIIKQGYASADQIEVAKKQEGKANQLARALVEMNVVPSNQMRSAVCDLATEIILSLFEWDQGEYAFDERVRAAHDIVLETSAQDCILEGARRASGIEHLAQTLLPEDSTVLQSALNGSGYSSLKLTSVESFVLSRIESDTAISDLCAMTGLPDEDTRRAVCTLLIAGLIKRKGSDKKPEAQRNPRESDEQDDSSEKLREEVSRKLHFFSSADFYEVLAVTRRATSGEIKTAYYQLAKKFHPDKYRQPEHNELRSKLEALFAKITQAYETLSDASTRAAYDEREKGSGSLQSQPSGPETRSPVDAVEVDTAGGGVQSEESHSTQHQGTPPGQAAEFYYQKGRARYDQKDYYAAVQLLREAVRLDSGKPQYQYHLGIALVQNPRTRREGETHLIKAAELDPFSAQIRVKLGTLYKEAGLSKKAETYFREALSIDPENRVARRELGDMGKKDDGSIWKSDLGTIAKRIFKK